MGRPTPRRRSGTWPGPDTVVAVSTRSLPLAALALVACGPASSPDPPDAWPATAACEGLDDWRATWAEAEADVLGGIAAARDEGIDCGSGGKHFLSPRLQRRAALDCAARVHALDMAVQQYVGRYDPEGRSEVERAQAADYSAASFAQHLAAGPDDSGDLLDLWWSRPQICADLASDAFTEVGLAHVGEVDDEFGEYWVVVLAQP